MRVTDRAPAATLRVAPPLMLSNRRTVKRICYYHAGCPDGFGAAWAVRRAWGESGRYVPRGHEDRVRLEDCEDALVTFVDIAPGREELRQLARVAEQVVVLDHHVTARERLLRDFAWVGELEADGHVLRFDLDHSGSVLAWRYFHPDAPVPTLLGYVQDQDLWTWALPDSDAVNAAIGSHPYTFEIWDRLAAAPIEELVREGMPILRANRMEVERRLDHAFAVTVGTRRVEAVNATTNRSQLGHRLAQRARFGQPWGLVYRVDGSDVFATLYSIGELDVSKIALEYGGGGHKNAAGFRVPLTRWVEEFVL